MNPLYQQLIGAHAPNTMPMRPNPMMLMQAMQNPAAFVKKAFPDIPDDIQNNPGQILQYLQRTRGITDEQMQQVQNQCMQQGGFRNGR